MMNKKFSREKSDLRYLKFCFIIFVKQSHKKLIDKGRLWTRNQTAAPPNINGSANHWISSLTSLNLRLLLPLH